MIDPGAVVANRAIVEALVEDTCPHQGIHAYYVARVGTETLAIDLPTVLKGLRLVQTQGAIPPLPVQWWTLVAMDHDIAEELFHGGVERPCAYTNCSPESSRKDR
ncbi:hypothetical protein [Roseospira visakhapatnamensis]|uniref:Uncharacterized protein n=1 Tax=Roseospira visakhapatnamensis TaxID=390880 RepID=A0A7W6RGT5_9PROT|nr:hypothetical protein [Roseospira visakhapatnamensis]MBB4268299.1 hypothetical protein [Roseospira visakhapatnamensis]